MAHGAHAASPRRVPFGEKLVLGDLGDGTGGGGAPAGGAVQEPQATQESSSLTVATSSSSRTSQGQGSTQTPQATHSSALITGWAMMIPFIVIFTAGSKGRRA